MATPDAVTVEGRVVMKNPKHAHAAGLALTTDPSVDVMVLFASDESLLKTGLPVDRFDVLVLAGPPQKSAVAAPIWPRWHAFASFLLKGCTGPVMLNSDRAQWLGMLPQLVSRDVREMPLAELPASLSRELFEN
jgi:hypothetical protein